MKLTELVQKALAYNGHLPEVQVSGVAQDHRRLSAGYIFVARSGQKVDGHVFVAEALAKGAIAIVGERSYQDLAGLPYIQVADARQATAKLAAELYHHPANSLYNIGITGTDGKTTTSFLLHHLLSQHHKTGLLSTAAIRIGESELALEGHFTTPEAPEVQHLLAQMRDAGCTYAVIESSSHGFAQHRLDGIAFEVGIWTNISPEHLDFHLSFEAYLDAKLTLMRRTKLGILNRDDASFASFAAAVPTHLSYGYHPESHYRILEISEDATGQRSLLRLPEGDTVCLNLPMAGIYNTYNAVAALIAASHAGVAMNESLQHLNQFGGVPGRMQLVQSSPFRVVVDFAHTPEALEKALQALRPGTSGNLIVVIGAAGERDPAKRPLLGKVAREHADITIFTEEDSRSENIYLILVEMAKGAIAAGGKATQNYWTIPDRREAIQLAIKMAQSGDTVLLAGKGHEQTLERDGEILPWDEVAEARRALGQL